MRNVTRRRAPQRGQALAEFAIILVVLMLLLLGIVDLSRAVYIRSVVANAAREGARYAVVQPRDAAQDAIASAITSVVVDKSLAGSVAVSPADVSVTWPDTDHVRVTVVCTYHPATALIAEAAGIGPGGIVLRGSSQMRREP
jgi:Flp pilus assembly protein TadG